MRLAELQRAFQNHVLHQDGAIAAQINGTPQMPVADRLEVYADAYWLRLVEALGATYPQLQTQIGSEAFSDLGRLYLQEYPSTHFSVRWFGDRLHRVLHEIDEYREQPWLQELARWEWALAAAFDAEDVAALPLEALASVEPSQWPSLQFRCHPSLHRLTLRTNAPALFKALADETETPAPQRLGEAQHWIIWRQELATRYRRLEDDEAAALSTVCAGGTFEEMCETLAEHHEPEAVPVTAAGMLKGWIVAGTIAEAVGV